MAVNPDPCWPQHRVITAFVHGLNAEKYIYRHQVEALCKVEKHFKDQEKKNLRDPTKPYIALVVLPTGCGKTGVAVLAPYLLNPNRVLVITPSSKISQQIYEEFCGKDMFLLKRGVIKPKDIIKFRPLSPDNYIKNSRDIERNLTYYSLMVVNAHKIGGKSRVKIADIPNDCFDLVIVDEAHHYPAPTWKYLVDHFPDSNCLFLTATPYYYKEEYILPGNPPCFSLSRQDAEARGIIRPVEFFEATAQSHPGMTPTEV